MRAEWGGGFFLALFEHVLALFLNLFLLCVARLGLVSELRRHQVIGYVHPSSTSGIQVDQGFSP